MTRHELTELPMLNTLILTWARLLAAVILALVLPTLGHTDEPKGKSNGTIACLVRYSGQVQGFGFRATTFEIAHGYPVTGWVKNLEDGRVELLVEGCEEDVEKCLEAVRLRWKGNIDKEQIERQKPAGECKGFTLRR
jgi:acylphosphatase